MADLGVKRTSADFDPFRGELEKILWQGISGNTAKTAIKGFGVADSQPGKQSVSADGASPATDATRSAATGPHARGIPFTDAKLAGAAGAGHSVCVGQNQAAKKAPKTILGVITMLTLQELLEMEIKENGEQSPLVQMLRNQIVAQRSGKTFQELYLSGSVNKKSTPVMDNLKKESITKLNDVSRIPSESQQNKGKLILNSNSLGVQITEEFEKDFAIILKSLRSKRKGKKYAEALTKLNSMIDESWLSDAGDRIGDGIPLNYLQSLLSDQHLSEMEGLDDEQIDKISNKQRLKFARNILTSIEESLDADICPGYWVLEVHGFNASFFLGYSVTGYSFSGIEWEEYGAFQTKSDFEDHIRIVDGMAINNKLSLSGKTLAFSDLSDTHILNSLWFSEKVSGIR